MAKKKTLKQLLKVLEPEELREIILELASINKKNQAYIRFFIEGSDQSGMDELFREAEKKIKEMFVSRNGMPKFNVDLRVARSLINEYCVLFKSRPDDIIKLLLTYVECCFYMNEFGEDYRSADSAHKVFKQACNYLCQYPKYVNDFKDRLNRLLKNSNMPGYIETTFGMKFFIWKRKQV